MITEAIHSRQALYRDTVKILQTHQRLQDGHPKETRIRFYKTTVTPDGQDNLFALFPFVDTLEQLSDGTFC
ncbi:hypothetical protein HUB97_14175 [Halorubraceae archaeon YAN]|nr:hypothetical protein [Halorubraceae archaeon YAN]